MEHWLQQPSNHRFVEELREQFSDSNPQVLIFLGAGLSFGASRLGTRTAFEYDRLDDDRRFPTWKQLVHRMKKRLADASVDKDDSESLERFFNSSGPLDCAELFHHLMGDTAYYDFLRRQYGTDGFTDWRITPSHEALVALPLNLLFTTNYDLLIEEAYRLRPDKRLVISGEPEEFADRRDQAERSQSVHLVKLHGTIDRPNTIVLTRTEYARSRHNREAMFGHLLDKMQHASFLFVGFSLSDPNINMLLDEARYLRANRQPISYVVQSGREKMRDIYLQSLGVNTIAINWWEQLPQFLMAINPQTDLEGMTK